MVDLKKFMCTEKVKYLGEYNIESDSDHSDTDTDENFGQEFYLGMFICHSVLQDRFCMTLCAVAFFYG